MYVVQDKLHLYIETLKCDLTKQITTHCDDYVLDYVKVK